jgi:pimeloyl-ACP methyl ester carboxylesterase
MNDWKLNVRGLQLLVREFGEDSSATPNVCLHGWLDHGMAFHEVANGRPGRWLALDQRGFGQSDHIGPGGYYHFADLIPDLDALVDHLGCPVNLLGHSMGGTVASIYAAVRPDKVHRLVVAEGLGAIEWGTPDMVTRIRDHLDQIRRPPSPVRVKDVDEATSRLLKRHPSLKKNFAKRLAEHGTIEDDRGVRWSFDPLHMVRGPYPFRESSYLSLLAAIKAPTLVIWGSQSWYPDEIRTLRAMTIPNVRVATIDGGHMLPYDAPTVLGQLATEHFST